MGPIDGQASLEEYARARNTDPDTSHEAAASVTDLTGKQRAVLEALKIHGPCTDQRLADVYDFRVAHKGVPIQSDSGLRTRRAELVEKGLVVDTGERVKLPTGRNAIVWKAL